MFDVKKAKDVDFVFEDAVTGFAIHPVYRNFSSPESGFSYNVGNGVVSVTDDIIYKVGYYSVNGSSWRNFTLSGSLYGSSTVWLKSSALKTLPDFGDGEHYVIVYSCSYNNGWDCHGNRWQLLIFNNSFNNGCSNNIQDRGEEGVDCGGVCVPCNQGNIYYVATNGNDDDPGTINQPWRTWGKAFTSTSVQPGDIVYFRGGVYPMPVTNGQGIGVTRSGTSEKWITYSNYPGETPILDGSNVDPRSTRQNNGIIVSTGEGANYVKFKGLTVRNILQKYVQDPQIECTGIAVNNGYFIFENCAVYNINGEGFVSYFYEGWPDADGEHYFINCDSYNNSDVLTQALPGNDGSGFLAYNFYGTTGHTYYQGCRAWNNGDQGFSSGDSYVEIDNCWSMGNGQLQGEGHGFKLGWVSHPYTGVEKVVKNSIAANNRGHGINTNDAGYDEVCNMQVYNNFVYHNGYAGDWYWGYKAYGFMIDNTAASDAKELMRVFRNNVAYENEGGSVYPYGGIYTHSNNNWDTSGITVTDADFVSLDINQLYAQRKADGSLPNITFGHLKSGSDLIDKGTNVGLPYSGTAPDLGAFEYNGSVIPSYTGNTYYVSTTGSNSNSGTIDKPFRTIQYAVNAAQPGNRVYVLAGTYYERIVFPRSGTSDKRIVVEGQRGANGEWLTIVNGGDKVKPNSWTPAPEISPWTYKTNSIPYESFAMTVRINGITRDIPRINEGVNYKDIFSIAPEEIVTTMYAQFDVKFWDGLEAAYAYDADTGTTYLRFRNGDNPNNLEVYSSSGSINYWSDEQGAVFFINDKSYITIKGFEIDGAQNGIFLYGSGAAYNIIEDNDIVNGQHRFRIANGANSNHIRNNEMHMRSLSKYLPGAWGSVNGIYASSSSSPEAYDRGVKEHIYNAYKIELGTQIIGSTEDDSGIYYDEAGGNNRIYNNRIYNTLGAADGNIREGPLYIYENEIFNISSIGLIVDDSSIHEMYFYKNKFYNVNIAFRVQMNVDDVSYLAKKTWFYENTVRNPEGIGSNIYFSRTPERPNPSSSSGYPKLYIYHNSFLGGGEDEMLIYTIGSDVLLLNNIFSDNSLRTYGSIGVVDYNWFGDGYDYLNAYFIGGHNIDGNGQSMWVNSPSCDFKIQSNSLGNSVIGAGIDLSKQFILNGKQYPAMPGMLPGYFKGTAPNLGAIQNI